MVSYSLLRHHMALFLLNFFKTLWIYSDRENEIDDFCNETSFEKLTRDAVAMRYFPSQGVEKIDRTYKMVFTKRLTK